MTAEERPERTQKESAPKKGRSRTLILLGLALMGVAALLFLTAIWIIPALQSVENKPAEETAQVPDQGTGQPIDWDAFGQQIKARAKQEELKHTGQPIDWEAFEQVIKARAKQEELERTGQPIDWATVELELKARGRLADWLDRLLHDALEQEIKARDGKEKLTERSKNPPIASQPAPLSFGTPLGAILAGGGACAGAIGVACVVLGLMVLIPFALRLLVIGILLLGLASACTTYMTAHWHNQHRYGDVVQDWTSSDATICVFLIVVAGLSGVVCGALGFIRLLSRGKGPR